MERAGATPFGIAGARLLGFVDDAVAVRHVTKQVNPDGMEVGWFVPSAASS